MGAKVNADYPELSPLQRLQSTGSMTVRARSFRTRRPVGRPFTIRFIFARCSYLIEQDGVVQEEVYLDRYAARDWLTRLAEVSQ